MKKPLVSVLMPNYNGEKYISEAIESILKQTYSNFEFIIIDDCSTDDSWKIIQKYAKKDKRIKAYRNEENLKIVRTRNKLFSLANKKTKYYAIFDSDDISLPDRLKEEVNFLEKNKEYGVVGSNIILINEKSKVIGKRNYVLSWEKMKKVMGRYDPIAQPSVMIRKKVIDLVGKYNEKYTRCQDYELWMRIGTKVKIRNLKKPLIKYRISSTQGKRTALKKTIKFTLEIQRKWLFSKEYFSIKNTIIHLMYYAFLLLPTKTILWMFEKMNYSRK